MDKLLKELSIFSVLMVAIFAASMIGYSIVDYRMHRAEPVKAPVLAAKPKPLPVVPKAKTPAPSQCDAARAYIVEFFGPLAKHRLYAKRMQTALDLLPVICEAASDIGIDPLLVVVQAGFESSFRIDVIGPGGELGMMQVKPGKYDSVKSLSNPVDAIRAGVRKLGEALEACPTLESAIGMYMTGNCGYARRQARERVKKYEEARSL